MLWPLRRRERGSCREVKQESMYGLSAGTERVAVRRRSTLLAIRLTYDQGLFYGGSPKVGGPAKEK